MGVSPNYLVIDFYFYFYSNQAENDWVSISDCLIDVSSYSLKSRWFDFSLPSTSNKIWSLENCYSLVHVMKYIAFFFKFSNKIKNALPPRFKKLLNWNKMEESIF